jgi:hypothetical protein
MELFNFIKVIFTNPNEYSSISLGEKRKQFFMCNRRFAIQFPLQANALQHLKINQAAVVDFWQRFLRKQYKHIPGWMYTKGIKKSQEVKEKKLTVSNDLIKEYCRVYKLDSKTIRDALEFYSNEMIKELKQFENIIKQK